MVFDLTCPARIQGTAEWNPAPDHLKATCMKAAKHAEEQGVALPKLALKYSLKSADEAGMHITLVGMSTPQEVCPHSCHVHACTCLNYLWQLWSSQVVLAAIPLSAMTCVRKRN